MKMIYRIILLVAIVGFTSCSSDERIVVIDTSDKISGKDGDDDDDTTVDGPTVAKKVLIEDYVATWCGNCILPIEKSEQADKNVFVPVAIHFLGSRLENETAIRVAQLNGVNSQTTIIVDKHNNHSFRSGFNASDYPQASLAAIAIESSTDNSAVSLNIRFKFYKTFSDLKYTVYLCANNVVAPQANYQFSGSIYQTSPRTISNFNHNHVLQKAVLQETIPNDQSINENVYQVAQAFNIQDLSANNLELIVFVESESEVLNTQIVQVGQSVGFHAER